MEDEMRKMEKGKKNERLSHFLDILKNMRRFYSSSYKRYKNEAPWVMIEFENRLNQVNENLRILVESVEKAISLRGGKIDAPSLDTVMDDLSAINHLAQRVYNPSGGETSYKDLIRGIRDESQVQVLWINKSFRFLYKFISQ